MKVKYKVLHYRPEAEWISVEFWDADNPEAEPWCHSFEFPDFSREKLIDQLRAVASRFAGSWTRIPDHPTELTIPEEGTLDVEPECYLPYEPKTEVEDEPEFDHWTQEITLDDIEHWSQETVGWTIRDLSQEEIDQKLDSWTEEMRMHRNYLLQQSDFFNFPDACVANVQDWLDYRQALRDLPEEPHWPKNIIWPERPEVVKEALE